MKKQYIGPWLKKVRDEVFDDGFEWRNSTKHSKKWTACDEWVQELFEEFGVPKETKCFRVIAVPNKTGEWFVSRHSVLSRNGVVLGLLHRVGFESLPAGRYDAWIEYVIE